jgi:VCBS repeat-containing protein
MRARLLLQELDPRVLPTFYGNQLFPLDNPWNQVISAAPVASNSDAIINRIVTNHGGTAPRLHADFGNPLDGNLYGIPVNVVDSTVPKVNVAIPSFGYPSESDLVQVPIPANAVIEGDNPTGPAPPSARGDSHLLVYDKTANVLYELYQAVRPSETTFPYGGTHPTGQWGAWQISYWDLKTNSFRTVGATSADAAGLPILTGLARPDEANPVSAGGQGVINHAIRMTVVQTRDMFVFPASHEASSRTGTDLPRMGERFRLKSSFVIPSNWSAEAKAIAQAMKDYGMIVADNGSDMFFTGMPSTQWNMSNVLQVQQIPATAFEVVDLTPVVTGLSVASGPSTGGTAVTISGRNFSGAAGQLHVLFGTVEASAVTILSDTQVVAVAPAHAAGTVDVRVQSGTTKTDIDGNPVFFGYGTSAISAADRFNFDSTPPSAPTANADTFSVLHDRTLTVAAAGVLGNDTSNPIGRALTAALVTGPLHGALTLNANGSFTYNPVAGYTGSDSFTYTANDGSLASSPATVTLSITDQAPTANADSYAVAKGNTLTVAVAGVLANDTDADGDALTAAVVTGPANGSLTLNPNGSFTYTPNAGFVGTDTFTYRANDKARDSTPATVTVSVTDPSPTANADSYAVLHDNVLTIASGAGVLANDTSNPAGHTLTAALVAGPAHGSLALNANGSFTYTPNAGFTGTDSFTYTANDGGFASAPATVALSVNDQAPVANADIYKIGKGKTLTVAAAGVLANDTDADGDALTARLVSGPANGSLTLNANGSFTYTPNAGFTGTDSFTYAANDKALDSSPATATINVATPPKVKSVVINNGSAQRSLIRSVTVTFDTLVTFDAGAFSLVRTGSVRPVLTRQVTAVNGETRVTFTFSGTGTVGRSLTDGNWTLQVNRLRVHRADDRSATMEANHLFTFHRLFGDADGDRDVDAADQAAFDGAFGKTDAASLATFDYANDRDVDAGDRTQFSLRIGKRI